jgi:electron transport complex protein RnfC
MRPHISGQPSMAIVIENDHEDRLHPDIKSPGRLEDLTPAQIVDAIKAAGLVGMGGAAFPTHVKLSPPAEKKIDTVIVNGAECEPYLTADHRILLEHPDEVVRGLKAVIKVLDASNVWVGIENNKPDAIAAMQEAVKSQEGISVVTLETKYPQGGEKQLINAVTGREVPRCCLPIAAGCIVSNVSTAAAVADAVTTGMPLVRRAVTVTGSVEQPSNLLTPVGTLYTDLFAACGGLKGETAKIISGGPMMGIAVPDPAIPVCKGTSGITVFSFEEYKPVVESNCIRCARCVDVCPVGLEPYALDAASRRSNVDVLQEKDAVSCINCGCCTYVCPAKRDLAHHIHLGKDILAKATKKK